MSIKQKILKLRAMIPENGASENEAISALIKANDLMKEHGLTEADLNAVDPNKDMSGTQFKYGMKAQHPCAKYCSRTIGIFCGVMTFYEVKTSSSNAYGLNDDIEMYDFLLKLVFDSMNLSWKEYLKTNPSQKGKSRHVEYWSFHSGFSVRICDNLNSMIETREKVKATGTDLVVKKQEIIVASFREIYPHFTSSPGSNGKIRINSDAYADGDKAGSSVNLNRPVGNDSKGFSRLPS